MESLKRYMYLPLFLALFAAPLCIRCTMESNKSLEQGRAALTEGRIVEASDEFRRSISWWSPIDNSATLAQAELTKIISDTNVPVDVRRTALTQLRSGIRTSRSFIKQERDDDQASLAYGTQKMAAEFDAQNSRVFQELYQKDPNYRWQFAANLFFWGWIAFVLALIWKGFRSDGTIVWSKVALPGIMCVISYALWLVSLGLA